MSEIHSCSYYCQFESCIKAQRDELRDRIARIPEMRDKDLLLMAGEMTASELRSVRVFLSAIARYVVVDLVQPGSLVPSSYAHDMRYLPQRIAELDTKLKQLGAKVSGQ